MPDEDPTPSSDTADTPDSGGDDQPSYAAGHDDDAQNPRPGSDDQPVTSDEIKAQNQAINDEKDRITQQRYRDAQDENNLQKELDDIKAEARANPPQPPSPQQLPAPLTQSDKNGIAVSATNILKWAALMGLAYGLSRRSKNRNAVFKLGLGAALQGYMEGNNEMRNKAATMWEKNRKAIIDQNREQQQTYNDIMKNRKLSMDQKLDVFKEQSALFRDARAHDAATRGDVHELQQMMKDKKKLADDMESHTRKIADQWLGWIGLGKKDGIDYEQWVMSKGGPDIRKAKNEDEAYQIEKDYPRHKMIEELAGTKAQEKLKAEAEADQRKFELHKKEKDYDMKLQQSGGVAPDDPNAPISDQKAQEMRDKIFGGSD
jgi:hypothetical protein